MSQQRKSPTSSEDESACNRCQLPPGSRLRLCSVGLTPLVMRREEERRVDLYDLHKGEATYFGDVSPSLVDTMAVENEEVPCVVVAHCVWGELVAGGGEGPPPAAAAVFVLLQLLRRGVHRGGYEIKQSSLDWDSRRYRW